MTSIALPADSVFRNRSFQIFAAVAVTVFSIFIYLIFGALVPYAQRQDARDQAAARQQTADIHRAGFARFNAADTYEYYGTWFVYPVGTSCSLKFGIDKVNGVNKPFLPLTGVEGGIIYVTYLSLKSLPQTSHCFAS